MAVIPKFLNEEYDRLLRMKKTYAGKIEQLPKGSISYKKRGNKKYPYLKYREGIKVKTKYLKMNNEEIKSLEFDINRRQKFKKILGGIVKDLKTLSKFHNYE